mmetsp:Transcript_99767/g.311473  ORF Transcript_99767/g.311473 Transcript_99767/m.311473 type:complete len:294 (+) Transcript_99767:62-943(+)
MSARIAARALEAQKFLGDHVDCCRVGSCILWSTTKVKFAAGNLDGMVRHVAGRKYQAARRLLDRVPRAACVQALAVVSEPLDLLLDPVVQGRLVPIARVLGWQLKVCDVLGVRCESLADILRLQVQPACVVGLLRPIARQAIEAKHAFQAPVAGPGGHECGGGPAAPCMPAVSSRPPAPCTPPPCSPAGAGGDSGEGCGAEVEGDMCIDGLAIDDTPREGERHSPLDRASAGASCSRSGPTVPDFVRPAWAPSIVWEVEVAAAVQALRAAAGDDCAGCGCGTGTSEIPRPMPA